MFQILIVDDDKNLKRGLSLLLTDSGYRTFFADNVKEALHTLGPSRHGWSHPYQTPSGL